MKKISEICCASWSINHSISYFLEAPLKPGLNKFCHPYAAESLRFKTFGEDDKKKVGLNSHKKFITLKLENLICFLSSCRTLQNEVMARYFNNWKSQTQQQCTQ